MESVPEEFNLDMISQDIKAIEGVEEFMKDYGPLFRPSVLRAMYLFVKIVNLLLLFLLLASC